jgi:hypothetical protein
MDAIQHPGPQKRNGRTAHPFAVSAQSEQSGRGDSRNSAVATPLLTQGLRIKKCQKSPEIVIPSLRGISGIPPDRGLRFLAGSE